MNAAKTACILCSRNCGLVVAVDGRRLHSIRGDPENPLSKGYLCQKAARLDHYQNHDDRLLHPLKREPDGSFARVSWEEALSDIAQRLVAIRRRHGGDAFAFVGGGGQGNHLGGLYGAQLLFAMKSQYVYHALGQEKTGDFWVNGRLFGSQSCHVAEGVEHSHYVVFIGCNPFQSHGIPNARDTLHAIKNDPDRTLVVIDPRRTETAKLADEHLQLKPSTDAYVLAAMLAIIVREGLHDRRFLSAHCTGFAALERALLAVPVEDFVQRAGLELQQVRRVARGFATAESACVRVDLGTQHTLHTTLNAYLEKLLCLITGNFGRQGGNNLHSWVVPVLQHTDERTRRGLRARKRTAHHGMHAIAGIYPPNILPDEILHTGEDRLRAVIVDSCNPLRTFADTQAQKRAFESLELLVVVDVAMTETARLAHYVLPAASQFEKLEATAFTMEFPKNYFHLRQTVLEPPGEALPEPEIYTRLLEHMGAMPRRLPLLSWIAAKTVESSTHLPYMAALIATLACRWRWLASTPSIIYRTLGRALGGSAAAAPLLPIAMVYAAQHHAAVKRAGHAGNWLTLGATLFRAIVEGSSGLLVSRHEFEDTWSLIKTKDRKVHLAIPELLEELAALPTEVPPGADYPFILLAGERRAYNANQIYRDPAWRKTDAHGAMRMHPDDAEALQLSDGARAICESPRAAIEVVIQRDVNIRRGVVSLPHGYGIAYRGEDPVGPQVNMLTWGEHCDRITKTPFHKYVPVHVRRA